MRTIQRKYRSIFLPVVLGGFCLNFTSCFLFPSALETNAKTVQKKTEETVQKKTEKKVQLISATQVAEAIHHTPTKVKPMIKQCSNINEYLGFDHYLGLSLSEIKELDSSYDKMQINLIAAATEHGYDDIVKELIAAGANVNNPVDIHYRYNEEQYQLTPIYLAEYLNYPKITKLLIEAGADVNAKSNFRKKITDEERSENKYKTLYALEVIETPLQRAVRNGSLEDVKLLIAAGADVNSNSSLKKIYNRKTDSEDNIEEIETPLQRAARNGSLDVVKLLIAAYADVNAKDNNGATAIMLATQNGNADIVKELIAAGADVNAKSNAKADGGATTIIGITAIMIAAKNVNADVVNQLIAAGADVNAKTDDGTTPIMIAALNGNADVVNQLIAAGADVNAKTYNGTTPIMIAALNGNADVVNQLIAAGADVNAKTDNGATAIMLAAQNGNADVVKDLIAAGADGFEISLVLYRSKADFTIEKVNTFSPISLAQNSNQNHIVETILSLKPETDDATIIANYYEQIKTCIQLYNKPSLEEVSEFELSLVMNNYPDADPEKIVRTKKFIEHLTNSYNEIVSDYSSHLDSIKRSCTDTTFENYKYSEKLSILYHTCGVREFVWETLTNGFQDPTSITAVSIFDKKETCTDRGFFNADYITSKDYFISRIQKDIDEFLPKAKPISKQNAKARQKANEQEAKARQKWSEQVLYYRSPRGKCERRCNDTYNKNSDMWNGCMSICKDKRSDIIE